MMPAFVAKRRVLPGERLVRDTFDQREIDVSQGMARESRGLLLDRGVALETLEARQTILEGSYALSSAVQRVPDVKRGEAVQLRMRSGSVLLSTQGQAEEPGYLEGQIRVMSQKTKRSLVGKLVATGVVEVQL